MGKLDRKIALITGARSGLGLATAQLLVNDGAISATLATLNDCFKSLVKKRADWTWSLLMPPSRPAPHWVQSNWLSKTTSLIPTCAGPCSPSKVHWPCCPMAPLSLLSRRSLHPAGSVYGASKAAIRSFARSWANDLKCRGIRVNVISPGPTDTSAFYAPGVSAEQVAQLKVRLSTAIPLGRLAQVEEIAKAALFLPSDDSSLITGSELL